MALLNGQILTLVELNTLWQIRKFPHGVKQMGRLLCPRL